MFGRILALALASLVVAVLLTGCGGGGSPSGSGGPVSPLGYLGRIAFTRHNGSTGHTNIFSMYAAGTGLTNLTHDVALYSGDPSYSPDGTRIVFMSTRQGTYDLFTMASNGLEVKRLTFDGALKGAPRWSPDGTMIAYQRATGAAGNFDLWTIQPDGTQNTNRTKSGAINERNPGWGLDSKHLYYDSDGLGDRDLCSLSFSDALRPRLTSTGEENICPALSPDGTKLIFQSSRTGPWHVYRMGSGGNAATVFQVTTGSRNDASPVYIQHGARIIFTSNRKDAHYQIFSIKPDGTDLKRLTTTANSINDDAPTWNNGA